MAKKKAIGKTRKAGKPAAKSPKKKAAKKKAQVEHIGFLDDGFLVGSEPHDESAEFEDEGDSGLNYHGGGGGH